MTARASFVLRSLGKPQRYLIAASIALLLALAVSDGPAQTYFKLHSLSANEGGRPQSGVVSSGSSLYGTIPRGGPLGLGALFSVRTDGSGFALVKYFTGAEGREPEGGLALGGATLYGTTYYGGISNCGTLFKVSTDGRDYTVLKSFLGDNDAAYPSEDLVLYGTTLYGVTGDGGITNNGTLFKIKTDGSAYAVLKRFEGGNNGANPFGRPAVSATTLYGVTWSGGLSNNGVLYKINTDGSAYAVLRDFTNNSEGFRPSDNLVLSGTTLYGAAYSGGISNNGVLFSLQTDGTGYRVLKKFTGGNDGDFPVISMLSGSTLYGFANERLFSVGVDGGAYCVLRQFTNSSDGLYPNFGLAMESSALYGTTLSGGVGDNGVVFGLALPTTSPNIFAAPRGQTVAVGTTVSFVVGASGAPPLSYEWFCNGRPVTGVPAGPSLSLSDVTPANSGHYTVTVTNPFGAASSFPATLDVVPPGDSTVRSCSEEALRLALSQGNDVHFACDGTLTLNNTIIIAANTVLDGGGRQITISGGNLVQVFQVASNVDCTLLDLTVANGISTNGGGLANAGTVNARTCVFLANSALGVTSPFLARPAVIGGDGRGGAIYNAGNFSANDCSFVNNFAVGGGGTDYHIAGANPWSTAFAGAAGGQGMGAAIFNSGQMSLQRSLLASNNVSGGPGGGGMNGWASGDEVGDGASGARGGNGVGSAVFNSGALYLTNCSFTGNLAVGGPGGQGGAGGAVFHNGYLYQGSGGRGGDGGHGWGTIYSASGTLEVSSGTVAYNSSNGGAGGEGGYGRWLALNGNNGSALGAVEAGRLVNTILSHNFPSNSSGTITDAGHNLSSDASCAFTHYGSFNNVEPLLAPLADNGGHTLTFALLPGSPAIDTGDVTSGSSTDQRGAPRPVGTAPDIGAYEYGALELMRIGRPQYNVCEISLREVMVPSCRLFTTTDFVLWSPIATNVVTTDGTVSFHVPVALHETGRFYRAALP